MSVTALHKHEADSSSCDREASHRTQVKINCKLDPEVSLWESQDDVNIEVIYACPEVQDVVRLCMASPVSVQQALAASGLLEKYALNIDAIGLGVFGERVELMALLQDQDRLEIYRPITMDPKEKRVMKVKDSTLPRRCR